MKKGIIRWVSRGGLSLVLAVSACNIFNPSGEGALPDDSEGMTSVGQSRLQAQDWDGAMEAFSAAIENDSTNSLAYFGYTKAVRFKWKFNGLELSKELGSESESKVPFLGLEDTKATEYLNATIRIKPVLAALALRDSLNRLYQYRDDPEKLADLYGSAVADRKIAYINDYLLRAQSTPGMYKEDKFPLMDGVINYEKILPDLIMVALVHTFVNMKDLNGDTVINEEDNIGLVTDLLNALNNQNGSLEDNLRGMIDSIMTNPEKQDEMVADFNQTIDKLTQGTDDIGLILEASSSLGGLMGGGNDSSSGGQLTGDIQGTIDSLGNASQFWRLRDSIDNDGDGCIDEEVRDGKDNDGDGIVDEDLRIQPYEIAGVVVVRQEHFIKRDTVGTTMVTIDTLRHLEFTNAPGFWGADHSNEQRFKVLSYIKGQKPPYQLTREQYDYAVQMVGGCWTLYPRP